MYWICFQEKEKELDIKNIYSNRLPKSLKKEKEHVSRKNGIVAIIVEKRVVAITNNKINSEIERRQRGKNFIDIK